MEEERKPSPLVLLRGDELFREARALRLANLRLGEQTCVLRGPSRKVGKDRRPHDVTAVERPVSGEAKRRDLLTADPQWK